MKNMFHTLFAIATIFFNDSMYGMKCCISDTTQVAAPYLPNKTIAQIAGYCQPIEKNMLMKVRKDFNVCLKKRELILLANPYTVSALDKIKSMFRYTCLGDATNLSIWLTYLRAADLNARNVLGMTPFHIASDNKDTTIMQLLVAHDADVNELKPRIPDLHKATYDNNTEAVKTLLTYQVNPNLVIARGITPLLIASYNGYIEIAELLINARADINQAKNNGWAPLSITLEQGHIELAKLLLKFGADANQESLGGTTPLYVASERGHTEMVQLLIGAGAQINQQDSEQWTALCVAVENGYTDIVQLLLAAGAWVNHLIKDGRTPLRIAKEWKHTEIIKLLEEQLQREAREHIYK